ncbi:MAG TPA: hypothetical protein VNO30_32890 [Kofleriaceae bacterium]|nr:hypothetical protein [Kofleriaceae bacterium]
MDTFVRELRHQSAYGSVFGTYVLDENGDLNALVTTFEPIRGPERPVNYRLTGIDLGESLANEALDVVIRDEARKPTG